MRHYHKKTPESFQPDLLGYLPSIGSLTPPYILPFMYPKLIIWSPIHYVFSVSQNCSPRREFDHATTLVFDSTRALPELLILNHTTTMLKHWQRHDFDLYCSSSLRPTHRLYFYANTISAKMCYWLKLPIVQGRERERERELYLCYGQWQ